MSEKYHKPGIHYVPPRGPSNARIMIIGEAPGADEEREKKPFVGGSGQELYKMLSECGIDLNECFITNVCRYRPFKNKIETLLHTKTEARKLGIPELHGIYPDPVITEGRKLLLDEIEKVKPDIIIPLGNLSLWALTGEWGITNWRGSEIKSEEFNCYIIPSIHPAAVLRSWPFRYMCLQDFRRVKRVLDNGSNPKEQNYQVSLRCSEYISKLDWILNNCNIISCDIETWNKNIMCIGFGWSSTEAICIPFLTYGARDYFSLEEEVMIVKKIREVLTSEKLRVIWQNGAFDLQYISYYWGFLPRITDDTMLMQHTMYPSFPKSLDFLSSMYCEHHLYWKDDNKSWKNLPIDMFKFWNYNCKDCCKTFEVFETMEVILFNLKLSEQYQFIMELDQAMIETMLDGILIDQEERGRTALALQTTIKEYDEWFQSFGEVIGVPTPKSKNAKPWWRSPQQQVNLFYEVLKLPVQKKKTTFRPTVEDSALRELWKIEPLLRRLIDRLIEYRSLNVFLSTFVTSELSPDGRIRCEYKVGGTETFRFASSADVFDNGGNLQNIPKGHKVKEKE